MSPEDKVGRFLKEKLMKLKSTLFFVAAAASLLTATASVAQVLCPDGSFVSRGPCVLCPDGSFIGGGGRCQLAPNGQFVPKTSQGPQLAPDGTFVPGGRGMTLCPDGSFVSGSRCVLTTNGKFVGQ